MCQSSELGAYSWLAWRVGRDITPVLYGNKFNWAITYSCDMLLLGYGFREGLVQRDAAHLSELIHLIYGAAFHPEQWSTVVASIAASLNSSKAFLFTPYLAPQHGGFVFPFGFDEVAIQLWATTYIKHDIRAAQLREKGLLRDGVVVLDEDLVPQEQVLTSRMYQEYLRVQGLGRVCIGVVFAGAPDLPAVVLPVHRGPNDPFNQHDVAWMKLLIPHVSRAMGVMLRLETTRVQNASLLASVDRLNFGVALLNEAMQVLHLNQAARDVLQRGDGLSLNTQQQFEGRADENPLQNISNWLEMVRNTPISSQPHFLQGAMVLRINGQQNLCDQCHVTKKYYQLQCVPLPKTDTSFGLQQNGRYVVFITDPDAVKLPDDRRLHDLYGLTSTQAKVACEFAYGASYKDVAQRLRISEDTIRSHIKEIYRKTQVNRQADLVRLILSISQCGLV